MNVVVAVLTENILPIFLVAGVGYALQRWQALDRRTLSRITLYFFSPCLVFVSLANSELPETELAELVFVTLITTLGLGALAFGASRLIRYSRRDTAALLITVMFGNTGNYGLTLVSLRYGDIGLSRAVVYYVTSTIVVFTVGVVIASMGELSLKSALSRTLRVPPIYAAIAAVIVYSFNITVPAPLMSALDIGAKAAIPVMLVVLGMQMAVNNEKINLRSIAPSVSLRLIGGPLVALAATALVGLDGLGRSASIIEASMPTAVITTILAVEFGLKEKIVTSVVVVSTLLSPLTIAATIAILGL